MQARMRQLEWAVQALAASRPDQVSLYPSFVCVSCELLLDFEQGLAVVDAHDSGCVTTEQRNALDKVAECVAKASDTPCFEVSELDKREWHALRDAAQQCLNAFGWDAELPPEGRSTYVEGS